MSDEAKGMGGLLTGLADRLAEIEIHPEFPRTVDGVDVGSFTREGVTPAGTWVAVRPCAADCEDKTYLGVYLGDFALGAFVSLHKPSNRLRVLPHTNPAIYVPDLKRVVRGCESWWGVIKGPDDLRKISDADIENLWYVKALKELSALPAESIPDQVSE